VEDRAMKQRLRVKHEAIFAERLASATPSSVNRWRRPGAAHFLNTIWPQAQEVAIKQLIRKDEFPHQSAD